MRLKFGNIAHRLQLDISDLAFYLFVYHFAISGVLSYNEYIGTIPAIPFRTVVLFGLPFLLFASLALMRLTVNKLPAIYLWRNLLTCTFVIYTVGVILYNRNSWRIDTAITLYNLIIIGWYAISFAIGSHLRIKSTYKKWITFFYLIQLLNVILNYNSTGGRIHVNYDHLGMLHFLGDSLAIWSLLFISVHRDKWIVLGAIFASIMALYLISSRTSLYAFILVIPVVLIKNKSKYLLMLFSSVFVLLIVLLFIYADELSSTRMLKFVFSGEDKSFGMRTSILNTNLNDLKENFFLGDYGGQLKYGDFGLYMHNYLSLWRQFGLIPFVIFLLLLFPFFKWWQKKYGNNDFLVYFLFFLLIEITFTRSYKSHFIWFAIGMITYLSRLKTMLPKAKLKIGDSTNVKREE